MFSTDPERAARLYCGRMHPIRGVTVKDLSARERATHKALGSVAPSRRLVKLVVAFRSLKDQAAAAVLR
jgi:hypothetical protein